MPWASKLMMLGIIIVLIIMFLAWIEVLPVVRGVYEVKVKMIGCLTRAYIAIRAWFYITFGL